MSADFSAFSNQTFDPAAWINTTVSERPDDEPLESYLASLAMKLHIISQDYTDQLETGMVEATTIMPRILGEVSRIEDVLKSLEAEMGSLATQLQAFDQRNVTGVEDLSRMDTLKTNIEKSKATLEEHARWSQLVREAKTFMDSGGRLSDSADRLETMFRSCDVLKNMPGHDERITTCEKFRESLLSALRPRLRQDVTTADLTPLREYLYVYDKLDKRQEFEEEYSKARPDKIKSLWTEGNIESETASTFISWYQNYVTGVISFLVKEYAQMKSLFGDERAPPLLCSMIKHTSDPSRKQLAAKLLDMKQPDILSEAYTTANHSAAPIVPCIEGADAIRLYEALESYFGGFVELLETYSDMETASVKIELEKRVDDIIFQRVEGDMDDNEFADSTDDALQMFEGFSERLLRVVDGVYLPVSQSLRRSSCFMHGIKVKPVFRSLVTTLAQFVKLLGGKIDEIRVGLGFEDMSMVTNANAPPASSSENRGDETTPNKPVNPVADRLTEAKKWSQNLRDSGIYVSQSSTGGRQMVPCVLKLLQGVGRLMSRVSQLDEESGMHLYDMYTSIFLKDAQHGGNSGSTPMGLRFCDLYLQQDSIVMAELKGYLTSMARNPNQASGLGLTTGPGVFTSLIPSISKLKAAAGYLLFDLCTALPKKLLREVYSYDETWAVGKIDNADKTAGGDMNDELDPSMYSSRVDFNADSILPQQFFTQIGEHLLSLVQELETFASSNALNDLLKLAGLGDADSLVSRDWKDLSMALDLREDEKIDNLCKRSICINSVSASEKAIFGSVLSNFEGYETSSQSAAPSSSSSAALTVEGAVDDEVNVALSMTFVNEYLGAIADSVVGLIVTQLAQIPCLSPQGRAQLEVDLAYVSNVINALGLRPHPMLVHTLSLLGTEPAVLVNSIDSLVSRVSISGALKKYDQRLVRALASGYGVAHNPGV